jgi:hypothetical protein
VRLRRLMRRVGGDWIDGRMGAEGDSGLSALGVGSLCTWGVAPGYGMVRLRRLWWMQGFSLNAQMEMRLEVGVLWGGVLNRGVFEVGKCEGEKVE